MTVNNFFEDKDKPFDFSDNSQVIPIEVLLKYHNLGFKLVPIGIESETLASAQEIEQYVPVNVYKVQYCQVRGFEFCFCKYIVALDPETGYWIVDYQGELSN